MSKVAKRTLTIATVVAAVSAPSTAYARINPNPSTGPSSGEAVTIGPSLQGSPSEGFQWGDAGIGAAAALVLLAGAGASSVMVRGRREHA